MTIKQKESERMKSIRFHKGWSCMEGTGSALGALLGGQPAEAEPVTLPHDAVISTEREEDPLGGGNGFYKGKNIHYIKTFFVPQEQEGKEIWLEFEGIYQNAFIYINGAFAGRCTYGYGNYYVDIARFLEYGKENTVKVVVKNGVPSGRWYTGGGIYRDVQLLTGEPLHVACRGAKVTTLDIEDGQAVLRVETPVEYSGRNTRDVQVCTELLDADGQIVAKAQTPVTVFAGEKHQIRQQLVVENAKLWDVEEPNLYRCRAALAEQGKTVDEWEGTFGIRRLQLDVRKGLRINGKPVKLRGGCIHHDHGILGAAEFEHAEERRIKKLKEAGYNAVRMSHHPAGKALLRVCDRLGMLVMDEFTDVWTTTKMDFDYGFHFDQCWEQDVENMVHKDYNHPCVILYSIGNEIPETGNKIDAAWGKKIVDKIRSIDDTRYTINCVNLMLSAMGHMDEIMASAGVSDDGGSREINSMMTSMQEVMGLLVNHEITTKVTEEAFGQVDIAGYNYAAYRYEKDAERFPNRIMLGSETNPPDLAYNWSLVKKYPQVLGDFAWTAWDYLGEAGIGQITYGDEPNGFYGSYPWRAAYTGTHNLIGDRQPISYLRQIIWGLRSEPYISIRPPQHYGEEKHAGQWRKSDGIHSWNWSGYEGKPVTVEVYADAEEVELFINDISCGRKAVGEGDTFTAEFDTVYEPGNIRAVAYKEGRQTEHILYTAIDESCIRLQCSRDQIDEENGIAFVEISITDKSGVLNPESTKTVHVSVEGGGILYGLGSADPKSKENYRQENCVVFEGRALAAVRASERQGTVTVSVSAEGCKTECVSIQIDAK